MQLAARGGATRGAWQPAVVPAPRKAAGTAVNRLSPARWDLGRFGLGRRSSPALARCAGKGGVLSMTRQLAMEGAPHNIWANTISPGMIVTGADFSVDGGATAW